ncbi:amidohydrolase family protein [Fluviibacterium sp. DFM31]|uniref:Amidohydrolase family protein n=1 Tax=Meridianimarinicoccus marinus TaxID=3231483 RepID=A0ABV3L0U8_9RHOB
MSAPLPPLRLTGGLSLRDGVLAPRSIALSGGRFAKGPFPAVDMRGFYLLPGIVDLQGLLGPGPSATSGPDPEQIDRDSAACGITTRCVTLPWSWEGPCQSPKATAAFARTLAARRGRLRTDLHLHLAADRLMVPAEAALLDLARTIGVRQVSFSNTAEEAAEMRLSRPEAFAQLAWTRALPVADLSAALDRALTHAPAMPRHLCRLAEAFDRLGVIYGSSGDDSAETREHYSMIGARVCYAPGTARVAAAARAVGDPVVADAAGLLFPDPARRTPPVADLLDAGLCSALAGGRHPAALAQAAFHLADSGRLPLERAWALISKTPAEILRLPDRGIIAPGKRADLTVVNADTRQVEATICAGRISFLTGEAATRFLGAEVHRGMAAE